MFAEMKSNEIESIDGTCKLEKKHRTILLNVPVPVIVIYFARRAWQRLSPHTGFWQIYSMFSKPVTIGEQKFQREFVQHHRLAKMCKDISNW